ncbi:N-acetylglucosamine-6-phosphate deacetylase [Cyanobacterium sp. IPPAS B-1200]|uniref:N-acetylglucosamine-6-phosphate deacetylase n=1 Tax=Cyanobacterium sp. IPPAS B-1200 TaxID=1562720 RepID=UPI0008527F63|nr:N-acetylglucosamine-6-phosphate deacetylase [Cyanobacterium sp. IPPAS B-1200]OEJ79668.1 N-acetylglucosamine-6-phosphate deacetylase [Cyanobacterium sp. IPPAS B-1200]
MIRLINCRLTEYKDLKNITINNNIITHICDSNTKDETDKTIITSIDLEGDYLSLGGVDLQINGGLGLAFPDLALPDIEKLHQICAYLWSVGVDQFMPTIVTTSIDKIRQSLEVIKTFKESNNQDNEAEILGVHLEGPFLNVQKKGAHPQEHLLPLNLDNIKKVFYNYENIIKIITLAPELDTKGDVIPYLTDLGVIVSFGHSMATAEDAKRGFDQGASMVTHAFNAMPSLHHREPGMLGEAIARTGVYCGLIADGKHVTPTMLKVILRASDYDSGIFLVSDALAPIGLDDGTYPWDERTIEVKNGTATLPDGTLSGTTLPLFVGAQNLIRWNICPVEKVIALVTDAPRRAMRMPTLEVGQKANLIRWHHNQDKKSLTWERISTKFDEV